MSSTKQPPVTSQEFPALTISIPPSSISLHLKMTSTMGSRAQLADVPKLHELIETQVRLSRLHILRYRLIVFRTKVKKLISEKATWKVVLPGMGKTETREPSDSSDG